MTESGIKYKAKVGAYWQLINQLMTNGMSFIIGIVMARLLVPDDYGIAALPAVFITIANVLIESGFGVAMVRKPDLTEKDISTAFYYSASIGLVCYVILFFASPWIAAFYEAPILEQLMHVTALTFLWTPLATPQNIILQRKLDFKTPARISIICRIVMGIIGITTAYLGFGVWALVISSTVASLFNVVLLWCVVRWFPKSGWSKDSFRYLWGFGNKMIVTLLMDRIYRNITPIVIGKFYTPTQLGFYNRAYQYAQLPAQQLTGIVTNVSYPVMSKMQNDITALDRGYRKMLKLTTFIVFPVMLMFCALSEPFVIALITDKWSACIPYLRLICVWLMFTPIHDINYNLLLVKGESALFLKMQIGVKIMGIAIMCITLPLGIVPFLIGSIVESVLALNFSCYYSGKLLDLGVLKQIRLLMPTLILSTVTAILSYTITLIFVNPWIQLIVGGLFGTLFYVVVSYIFRFTELDDVKYMISKKK